MKRLLLIMLMVFLAVSFFPNSVNAEQNKLRLGIEAGYFTVSDEDFKDIYGSGGIIFGANVGYFLMNNIEVIGAVDFYSDCNKTAITQEAIEIDITYLRFGAYYHFTPHGIDLKAGGGLDTAFVVEGYPWSGFNDSGIGWFVGVGAEYPVSETFSVGADLIYRNIKIKGGFGNENVGGLAVMATVRIGF